MKIKLYTDGDIGLEKFKNLPRYEIENDYTLVWTAEKKDAKQLLRDILDVIKSTRLDCLNWCFKDIDLYKKLPKGKFENGNYNIEIKRI